jgi:hypothetical protein
MRAPTVVKGTHGGVKANVTAPIESVGIARVRGAKGDAGSAWRETEPLRLCDFCRAAISEGNVFSSWFVIRIVRLELLERVFAGSGCPSGRDD